MTNLFKLIFTRDELDSTCDQPGQDHPAQAGWVGGPSPIWVRHLPTRFGRVGIGLTRIEPPRPGFPFDMVGKTG